MLVYLITNLLNNKQYVGQTTQSLEKRWQRHCWISTSKNSMPVCKAIAKYGKENFKIEILIYCSSQDELNEKEIFYTNKLNTWSPNGYNLKAGNGAGSMSQETKDKIGRANLGSKRSLEARQNMSNAHKGIPLSKKHRESLSKAQSGSNNGFYGKKHTQESIDKFSKTYTLISPTGEIMTIKNMAEHCRKYGLSRGTLSSVVKGTRKSHKGWRLFVP